MAYSDRELLARILQCEAGGEGENGMKAVTSVIMNRVHVSGGEYLKQNNIIAEFFDADFITLMFTPENKDEDLKNLYSALSILPKREKITSMPPALSLPHKKTSVRAAIFSKSERIYCGFAAYTEK